MPKKPLVVVTAAAVCDYLIWTLASDVGIPALALVTGVALAPLLLTTVWLAVLAVVRAFITRPVEGSQAPDVVAKGSQARRAARMRALSVLRPWAPGIVTRGLPPQATQGRTPALSASISTKSSPPSGDRAALPLLEEAQATERRIATWRALDSEPAKQRSSSDEIAA